MDEDVRREFAEIRAILRVVAERQAAAEVRMDRAEARADRADARMGQWEKRADRADERMDRAEKRADQADARMRRWEARMDRADERMDRADARAQQMDERFEKRMRGFEKLVQIGMRELADLRRSQQQTQASLRAFMDSLRRGGNGRNGGRPH